ncbi:MAG TPA: type VI secretion system tip protein VgrG [Azonexus sp.]|nr:type VI secretion system tip protein VgrG [Azonexus sp.]
MPETRALPIAAEHREFTIKAGGEAVPREHQLLAVSVTVAVNRIAAAKLVYVDGAASTGQFPLSDSDLFKPGQRVEILAGAGRDSTSVFIGKVVRQGVRVREAAASQLVVECRHEAMKLSVADRSADYFEQSDSEVIEALLGNAGVGAEVEATSLKHKQLLQYQCTDWDFLLDRARANGQLAWCEGEKVLVRKPALDGAAVCTLQYGATLLEFEGEIDARLQHPSVKGASWDAAGQEAIEVEAATPGFTAPGNLGSDELAGVADRPCDVRHPALPEAEAQAWVDGIALYRRLDQVSGRGKCEGIASLRPGVVVELAGLGRRFNGKVLVTGVRHEFSLVQGWKTHVQFGGVDLEAPRPVSAPAAGGLLPAVSGLQIGIVTSNEDPDNEHRVRVRLPLLGLAGDGLWARVASLDAGDDRGFFFRPEIGDEVTVGFLDADPRHPVILGMLHSSAKPAPLQGSDDNHEKMYKSRSGMKLHFDDDKKVVTLATPAGNSITLSDEGKSLTLADQNGNSIKMDSDGIHLKSAKAVEFKASTETKMEAGTGISIKATTELKLEGASAELKGSAMAKLSGAMVQIN